MERNKSYVYISPPPPQRDLDASNAEKVEPDLVIEDVPNKSFIIEKKINYCYFI